MNRHTSYNGPRVSRSRGIHHSEFVHVLLFYILPFIIVNALIFFLVTTKPEYELTVAGTDDYRTTEITFTIKSHMPLKNVTIQMNSEPLDLVKTGKKTYTSTITHNGVIEIFMENFNGMTTAGYERIDILDDEPPTIEDYVSEDGILSFTVTDTQAGVDYDSIHALSDTGESISPLSIDKATGRISFQMDPDGLTVSIKDLSGNEYLTTFSLNTSGENDSVEESSPTE